MSAKFLPHLPSLSGKAFPTSAPAPDDEISLEAIAPDLFLGYHPPTFAQHLAKLNDDLPLPQVFSWRMPETLDESLAPFNADERRLIRVMGQLLDQNRKSGKYAEAFGELMRAHPDSEFLAMMLLNYLHSWFPEQVQERESAFIADHPDWLTMRFGRAAQLLLQTDPLSPDPAVLAAFLELMEHRLELHEHLPRWPEQVPADETVMMFYTATAAYFIVTNQYYRAIYSLTMVDATGAQRLASMMNILLQKLLFDGKLPQLRQFLAPLQHDRERRREATAGSSS